MGWLVEAFLTVPKTVPVGAGPVAGIDPSEAETLCIPPGGVMRAVSRVPPKK
jgi:hypothetical protein